MTDELLHLGNHYRAEEVGVRKIETLNLKYTASSYSCRVEVEDMDIGGVSGANPFEDSNARLAISLKFQKMIDQWIDRLQSKGKTLHKNEGPNSRI